MNEFNICIVTKFIITNNFKKKYKYIMYFLVIYL